MEIKDIVAAIPDILLYFIPGYIAISIKKSFRQEENYNDRDIILLSIMISFLIVKTVYLVLLLGKHILFNLDRIVYLNVLADFQIILSLIVAVIVGYAITILPDTKLAKCVRKFFKANTEPYSTVWNCAMKNPKGAWARVYIYDEDIGYVGKLIKYTCNPDSAEKEIYLSSFTSFRISDNTIIDSSAEGNDAAGVLINTRNVNRIEIFAQLDEGQ